MGGSATGAGASSIWKSGFSWSAYWATRCDTWYKGTEDEIVFAPMLAEVETSDIIYKVSSTLKIHGQRENKSIGWMNDYLYYSDDNSKTFVRGAKLTKNLISGDINNIGFCWIWANGNINFAIKNKIFLSTDNLKTFSEITVRDSNGDPISTAQNGEYYRISIFDNPVIINNIETLTWGNYTNLGGYSEINVYHATDDGATITMIYQFGQNSLVGSFGDAGNPLITRHVHAAIYNKYGDYYIVQTGDDKNGTTPECHVMKFVNNGDGTWDITLLASGYMNSRYKQSGLYFPVDGTHIYIGSDSSDVINMAIWKVLISDLSDGTKYVEIIDGQAYSNKSLIYFTGSDDGIFLCVPYTYNGETPRIILSKDFGVTSKLLSTETFSTLTDNKLINRFQYPNDDGFYLSFLQLDDNDWGAKYSLFIKVK